MNWFHCMGEINLHIFWQRTVLIPAAIKSITAAFLSRKSRPGATKIDLNTRCTLSMGHMSASSCIAFSTNTDIMLKLIFDIDYCISNHPKKPRVSEKQTFMFHLSTTLLPRRYVILFTCVKGEGCSYEDARWKNLKLTRKWYLRIW